MSSEPDQRTPPGAGSRELQDVSDGRAPASAWDPGAEAHDGHCQNCGAPVTEELRRTMGDQDDRVYACTHCTDGPSELRQEAAGLSVGWRKRMRVNPHQDGGGE